MVMDKTLRIHQMIQYKVFCRALLTAGLILIPLAGRSASLWKHGHSVTAIADHKARAVGDIVTIIIQENNSKRKDANTATEKKTSTDMSISSFLFAPQSSGLLTKGGKFPALKYGSAKSFDGGGSIRNSEQISARIAVRVIDRLPNGNLIVEGRRVTSFADESGEIILRGVVRAADVTAANTVFSYNVADATIHFVSKGTLKDEQRKGWFTKLIDKVSPF